MSWIGSLICPGGLLGTLLYGWMIDRFGRKVSILSITFPQIFGWLFVAYAENEYHLYLARILSGFAGGAAFVAVPIYIAEIAETRLVTANIFVLECFYLTFTRPKKHTT